MLAIVDLEWLLPACDCICMQMSWTSVPPERLLKASLPIALYSVRSERTFCEASRTTCPAAGSWTWI